MSDEVRTRFAPSPTGYLHLGGLRTALYTYLFAKKHGGKFILRIEDTDQEREVPGAVDLIYKSMRQAGLAYDEGPDVGGEYGPYIQTQRRDLYPKFAWELVEKGGAYCCFCTKEEIEADRKAAEAKGETYKYNKKCLHNVSLEEAKRRIAAGEPYVIRQNVPTTGKASFDDMLYGHVEVDCDTLDDNVLIKADGLPTYNFANVVDDHLMAISHVMRGTEYLSSAPKYNLLYEAFGWKPPIYLHLPPVMIESVLRDKETKQPILDENGNEQPIVRKLSKRWGDPSFEDLLQKGYLKEAIINYIALLGWAPKDTNEEFFSMDDLIRIFDENGINKSPSIFDTNKLTWFNAEYIRRLTPEDRRFILGGEIPECAPVGIPDAAQAHPGVPAQTLHLFAGLGRVEIYPAALPDNGDRYRIDFAIGVDQPQNRPLTFVCYRPAEGFGHFTVFSAHKIRPFP